MKIHLGVEVDPQDETQSVCLRFVMQVHCTLFEFINQLCLFCFVFTRVAHNSHATDKPVTLEFPIELEFRNVDFFVEGGKPENPEKNLRSKDENQQQTQVSSELLKH